MRKALLKRSFHLMRVRVIKINFFEVVLMKKYKDSVGRVYLYLFSMLGLVLVVIGSVGLINLGLKTWVFDTEDPWLSQPPMPPFVSRIETISSWEELSEQDRELLNSWLRDYESWEQNSQRNYQNVRNRESAANNLALLFVGLPLFLFHWRIVRKESD